MVPAREKIGEVARGLLVPRSGHRGGGGVDKWSKGSILNRIATQGDQTAGCSGY
jgi:hypothetical protein